MNVCDLNREVVLCSLYNKNYVSSEVLIRHPLLHILTYRQVSNISRTLVGI